MKSNIFFLTISAMTLAVTGCKKYADSGETPIQKEAAAPDGFLYATSKKVTIDVQLLTNDDRPLSGIPVSFFAPKATTSDRGTALHTLISDANGYLKTSISIPAYYDTLLIDPAYLGLPRDVKAYIQGGSITGKIGGKEGISGTFSNNLLASNEVITPSVVTGIRQNGATAYSYMGSYTTDGTPKYFEATNDVVSSGLLANINQSLPEGKKVPATHPQYMTGRTSTDLVKQADVWITFVAEGAGYYNSLGYYTYPTNKPPKTADDITEIKVAIPNASLAGSGGSMKSGNKIKLGRFDAGTSVGFVIFQNAWDGNKKVTKTDNVKYYTDDILNDEKEGYKRHSVLLWDDTYKLFLIGFEDLKRDAGGSDDDFNDLVFYVTSNPVEATSKEDVSPMDTPKDSDGDGVTDVFDQFPNDPARAYIQYFPSEKQFATLAFEDRWPNEGDYDMNDMILDYRYKFINNAKNETVEMYGDYTLRATGASFANGFGVQLPFTSDKIASVDGQKLIGGYVKTNANKTEASQDKAVIIPFDDSRALIYQGGFANTRPGVGKLASDTGHVFIKFVSPLSATVLGAAPFNPFLISNQRRGYEIHLPGTLPTSLADKTLFGTQQDNTVPAKNKYYLTVDNQPWVLSFTEGFKYPIEEVNINKVYLRFAEWAKSGGALYTDWYSNAATDFRVNSNIYQ